MKRDKKDLIIIILIVSIIIVLALLFLLGREKNTSKSGEYNQYNVIDISDCNNKCDNKYKFNNNIIRLTQDENLNYQLRTNNKIVLTGGKGGNLFSKIYTFDNNMIVSVYYKDVESLVSYIYNIDKKELNVIEIAEDASWNYKGLEVKDNVITYEVSRFSIGDNYDNLATHESVSIDNCEAFTKYKDKEIARTYESKYENGSFSKPVLKQEILLKNYKNYSKLCN